MSEVYWMGQQITTTEQLIAVVIEEASRAWDDGYDAANTCWQAMTSEAKRMQLRHLDDHHGDVYHAMQTLVSKYGCKDMGPMIEPLKDSADV